VGKDLPVLRQPAFAGVGFSTMARPPHDPTRHQPTGPLRSELEARITSMEALLGNLLRSERRNGVQFRLVKRDLRTRLTACYLARACLRRGDFPTATSVEDLLRRVLTRLEHRRFRSLGRIDRAAIDAVDWSRLLPQLVAD
jgi:hypothetical protein